jgi:hypothetical protein
VARLRDRPAEPEPIDKNVSPAICRLALSWCVPALDPATPDAVRRHRATVAARIADLIGHQPTETEIRELRAMAVPKAATR